MADLVLTHQRPIGTRSAPAYGAPSTILFWLGLLIGIVAGGYSLYERLTEGHTGANYGSLIPWGIWVALYVYFVGLAAGAFAVAALHYVFGVTYLRRVAPIAALISLVALGAGLFFIWIDLGHLERFWKLFVRWNPSSMMSWMLVFYSIYGLVVISLFLAVIRNVQGLVRPLALAGLVLAIIFGGGEGALFGVLGSQPTWNSGLLPINFLFSSLLAGVGVVVFALAFFRPWAKDREHVHAVKRLAQICFGLILLNILLTFAEYSVSLYAAIPAHTAAYQLILFGPYAWVFWGLQVGVGLVVPLAVLLLGHVGRSPTAAGLAGLMVAIGYAGTKLNLVIPTLAIPEFEALPAAYIEPRLATTYFPSLAEGLMFLGIAGLVVAVFIFALRRISLAVKEA